MGVVVIAVRAQRLAEPGVVTMFYAAYVLVLVLGLRKGELLGLTWELVDHGRDGRRCAAEVIQQRSRQGGRDVQVSGQGLRCDGLAAPPSREAAGLRR